MVDEVLRNCTKSVGISDNNIEVGNRLLAFFYLMLISSLTFTLSIVFFNLSYLVLVKGYSRSTTVINEIDRNAITHRFGHRVSIYNSTKDFYRIVNGCTRKANVSSIRQRIVQVLGKAIRTLYPGVRDANLLVEVDLATVRFIGNADNIASVREHLQVLGELLNGSQIYTTACPAL